METKTIEESIQATKLFEHKKRTSKYSPQFMRDDDEQQHHDTNNKWINKCRYCGDKWSYGHKYSKSKSYRYEGERELDTSTMTLIKIEKKEEEKCLS